MRLFLFLAIFYFHDTTLAWWGVSFFSLVKLCLTLSQIFDLFSGMNSVNWSNSAENSLIEG